MTAEEGVERSEHARLLPPRGTRLPHGAHRAMSAANALLQRGYFELSSSFAYAGWSSSASTSAALDGSISMSHAA